MNKLEQLRDWLFRNIWLAIGIDVFILFGIVYAILHWGK